MKRYASYKASGVEWLGELPEHWTKKRLRDCIEGCANGVWGDEPDRGEDDIPVIRVADFDRERRQVVEYETHRKVDASQRQSRALNPGDLLIEKSGGGEQQPVGMVVSYLGPAGAVCSNFVARMPPRSGVISRFMVYLHAYLYASRVTGISIKQTTGIQNLDATAYLSQACFLPPPDEQQAIADYLDAETARIDTLIQEKEGLIGLLREWRQSVIAEAVTKGLDERVAMKPSGVTWLGELPEHWKIERLRFRVKLNPLPSRSLDAEQLTSFLPMEAIGDDGTLDLERTRRVGEVASGYTFFEDGDIAIAKITPCYENGKGAVMVGLHEGIGFGTTELIVMRPTQADCPQWLYYLTMCSAFRLPGEALMQGAGGQKRVPDLFVKDYVAPVPPLDEQQAIADHLDVETTKIDTLITHTQEAIALLKELRAATIADAVLGRVDVR